MTRYRKQIFLALCALAGIWLLGQGYALYRIKFPNRNHAMIAELQDMQTFCIGRYQIDLPRGTTYLRSTPRREGVSIFEKGPMQQNNYRDLLETRWKELQARVADTGFSPPEPYTEPAQRIEIPSGGVLFTFDHRERYLESWPGGGQGLRKFYKTEGHLLREGRYFLFEANTERELTAKAMQQLQVRSADTLPSTPGFCGKDAFFPGEVPNLGEGLLFGLRLPDSQAGIFIDYPSESPPSTRIGHYNNDTFKAHLIREASFPTNGMVGQEQVDSASEMVYQSVDNGINARWYFPGPVPGYPDLGIQITLSYSKTTDKRHSDFGRLPPRSGEHDLDEEKFLALWDGIMKTFRLRPGAL